MDTVSYTVTSLPLYYTCVTESASVTVVSRMGIVRVVNNENKAARCGHVVRSFIKR